ncbi:hypothetical protein [Spirosoma litoris]
MTTFDDLADRAGILKAILELSDANQNYGKVAITTNENIRLSQIELIKTIQAYKAELIGVNTGQKAGQTQLDQLKDSVVNTTTAYKNQSTVLTQNTTVIESNNRVLDAMKARLIALQQEYEKLDLSQKKDLKRKKEIEQELTQTTRALKGLTTATETTTRAQKAAEGSTDALRKSTLDLKNQLNALPDAYNKGTGKINEQNKAAVALNKQYQESIALLKKIDASQGVYNRNVGNYPKGGGGIGGALGMVGEVAGLGSLASGAGIAAVAVQATGYVLEVGQQYEKLNLLTENALNNNKKAAAEASKLIRDFADHSPADIETVTEAFNRLVDIGIIPTKEQLTELSDVAIAKNKTIMDYVEAIADAQMGEFGRLKEFGINASKQGDKVIFTFKGVRTEVEYSSKAISDYLIGLGKVNGVMGATDKLAQSFAGRWSTVKDGFKGVANDIFQILIPALTAMLGLLGKGISLLSTYTTGLRALYNAGSQKAGFIGGALAVGAGLISSDVAMSAGRAVQSQQAGAAGTPETDKLRKQAEAQQKINDANRKKAEAAEKAAKEADKILNQNVANAKAANDQLLAANEAAYQDGLISERKFIEERQKITLSGIAERQALLAKAGKKETDDYKKLSADKIEAQTQYKRDSLKLSLSESKADAANAIAGIGRDNQDGSLSDADYVERKRSILVASLNEQKQILVAAGQGQSKLAQEIDKQLLDADRDYFKERLKVATDGWKKELDAAKDGLTEIDKSTAASYEAELAKIDAFYGEQRAQVEMKRRGGKLSEPDAEKQMYAINISELQAQLKATQAAYNDDQTASDMLTLAKISNLEKYKQSAIRTPKEIEAADAQIAALKKQREQDAADDKKKLDKEVADNAKKQATEEANHSIAEIERTEKRRKAMVDVAMEIGSTLVNGLFSIEQQNTQNKLTQLDKQQQYELDAVGDNESAKAFIQKKFDAERKQLQHKQDIANREQALFNVGVSTAQAIMKTYAEFGFPFGTPLALLQGALGAVQAGVILATALPQYFAGKGIDGITNDNYAGPAIAGERGRELWQHDGRIDLLDKPSLINVGRNDVIYPNWLTEQMLEGNAIADRVNSQSLASQRTDQNREAYQVRQYSRAMSLDGRTIKQIGNVLADEVSKLPFNYSYTDANGTADFTIKQNQRIIDRTKKHRPGR